MAYHSSAKKSIRKTAKRAAVNRNRRTRVRTYIKKVVVAVEANIGNAENAAAALISAQSEMMRAVSKGIIKKNTASRKISRLAKRVKTLSLQQAAI